MTRLRNSSIFICILVLATIGCSGSQITKAYNTQNVVQSGYNAAGPILKTISWPEEQKPIVEKADRVLHDAISAGWATLVAVKQGQADGDDIKTAFHAILAALGELSQLVDNQTFKNVVKGIQTALEFYLDIKSSDAHYFKEFQEELAVMAAR